MKKIYEKISFYFRLIFLVLYLVTVSIMIIFKFSLLKLFNKERYYLEMSLYEKYF